MDYFALLPPEITQLIFDNLEPGNGGLSVPISKALVPFQQRRLFRRIRISQWDQFEQLCRASQHQSSPLKYIEKLEVRLSPRWWSPTVRERPLWNPTNSTLRKTRSTEDPRPERTAASYIYTPRSHLLYYLSTQFHQSHSQHFERRLQPPVRPSQLCCDSALHEPQLLRIIRLTLHRGHPAYSQLILDYRPLDKQSSPGLAFWRSHIMRGIFEAATGVIQSARTTLARGRLGNFPSLRPARRNRKSARAQRAQTRSIALRGGRLRRW